ISSGRLTVKLRGRPEAPDWSRGCKLSSRTRGDTTDVHGPLQRLLDGTAVLARGRAKPRKVRSKKLKEQPEQKGPNGDSNDAMRNFKPTIVRRHDCCVFCSMRTAGL